MISYAQEDIQKIIKKEVSKPFMFNFFDKVMNEQNIAKFARLLGSDIDSKYLFDLIVALLYKEVISIETIYSFVGTYPDIVNLLEKAVVLEYGLYEIPGGLVLSNTTNEPIRYIRDFIPRLYYGQAGILSYKDQANIASELTNLYETVTPVWPSAVDTGFSSLSMTRINDAPAYIEQDNVPLYNFLINYDITNIYFIRKNRALNSGVYGKTENGIDKIKSLSELRTIPEFHYSKYHELVGNPNHANWTDAHNFLLEFHEKIKNGTINY